METREGGPLGWVRCVDGPWGSRQNKDDRTEELVSRQHHLVDTS